MLLLRRDLCSPQGPVAPLLVKISLCMNKREVREGKGEREGERRKGREGGGEGERERGREEERERGRERESIQ